MKKVIDTIALVFIAVLFFALAAANLIQPERAASSASEKREFVKPALSSFGEITDGSYFKSVADYVSDTFVSRERLIVMAKKLRGLFALDISHGTDETFVYLGGDSTATDALMLPDIPEATYAETTGEVIETEMSAAVTDASETEDEGTWVAETAAEETEAVTEKVAEAVTEAVTEAAAETTQEPYEYKGEADFYPNGLFIYGDAVYSQGTYAPKCSEYFAGVVAYYSRLFPKTKVSVLIAPLSSMTINDPVVTAKIVDQRKALLSLENDMEQQINFVNVYDALYTHRGEYLYFKSDHHWTMRGAYYAYSAFAKSLDMTPAQLEDFEDLITTTEYQGTMYSYTLDERVKKIYDSVEIFLPRKANTMTITYTDGSTRSFDSCILNNISKNYNAFIGGDNPYTVINVPENPQDKNILVLKDSFGNAMIPFLCEHFGNIIVVDGRYCNVDLYKTLADYPLTDILFLNNLQSPNSTAWSRLYLAAVGVK